MHCEHTLQLVSNTQVRVVPADGFALSPAVGFALLPVVGFALSVLHTAFRGHFVVLSCPLSSAVFGEPLLSSCCSPVHVLTHVFPPHAAQRALPPARLRVLRVVRWLLHQHHTLSAARCARKSLAPELWQSRWLVTSLSLTLSALGEGQNEATIVLRGLLRLPGCMPTKA